MITLILDTSFDYLVVAVAQDNKIIYNQQLYCFKNQSEQVFVEIEKMEQTLGLTSSSYDEVVVTSGPGSYTGVRIALTIAKVMAKLRNIPLYTISSLKAIIGHRDGLALIDARAKRAYSLEVSDGVFADETIVLVEDIEPIEVSQVFGHTHLLGEYSDQITSIAQNIIDLKDNWVLCHNIDQVTPMYLKDNQEYVKN